MISGTRSGWRHPESPVLSNSFTNALDDGADAPSASLGDKTGQSGQYARGSCCYSGAPRQAAEMGWEELQGVRQGKCKVLKCGRNNTLRTFTWQNWTPVPHHQLTMTQTIADCSGKEPGNCFLASFPSHCGVPPYTAARSRQQIRHRCFPA